MQIVFKVFEMKRMQNNVPTDFQVIPLLQYSGYATEYLKSERHGIPWPVLNGCCLIE